LGFGPFASLRRGGGRNGQLELAVCALDHSAAWRRGMGGGTGGAGRCVEVEKWIGEVDTATGGYVHSILDNFYSLNFLRPKDEVGLCTVKFKDFALPQIELFVTERSTGQLIYRRKPGVAYSWMADCCCGEVSGIRLGGSQVEKWRNGPSTR